LVTITPAGSEPRVLGWSAAERSSVNVGGPFAGADADRSKLGKSANRDM